MHTGGTCVPPRCHSPPLTPLAFSVFLPVEDGTSVLCDTKSATSTACTFDAAAARLAQGSSIALHTSTGDQLI